MRSAPHPPYSLAGIVIKRQRYLIDIPALPVAHQVFAKRIDVVLSQMGLERSIIKVGPLMPHLRRCIEYPGCFTRRKLQHPEGVPLLLIAVADGIFACW